MSDFDKFLKKGSKGHLIGIGGVSMSPLAEVLHDAGLEITGSDIAESERTSNLRGKGIEIFIGHDASNITPDTQFVVRTAAAHDDNPEVIRAHEMGIPVFERTQAWGAIMKGYKNALCISGTHGKTTTTSMCTHILMAAEKDPTVMIGGTLPLLKAGHRVGTGDTIVMESCEYYNSFLSFYPTVAVILNIEEDHLDFFSGIEDIKKSFREFASHVPEDGYVVVNHDDENTMDAVKGLERNIVTFGLTSKADVYAKNVIRIGSLTKFDIMYKGKLFDTVNIHVPGVHNLKNALAAAAACICLGIKPTAIKYGLAGFSGAGRRFEFKGKFNGADVYDDYAHHPTEIAATLDAARQMGYDRVICVYQPHTYSRTKGLFDEFAAALGKADLPILCDIYAARETDTLGVSSELLAKATRGAVYMESFDRIADYLREHARAGDLILTMGAGDIAKLAGLLLGGK